MMVPSLNRRRGYYRITHRRVQCHELPAGRGHKRIGCIAGPEDMPPVTIAFTRLRTGIKTQWHCVDPHYTPV